MSLAAGGWAWDPFDPRPQRLRSIDHE